MHQAAQHLLGKHDFSSFRASQCQAKTPIRILKNITVTQHNKFIKVDICANAFLHHMVRNIVGALLVVGEQKQPMGWIKEVLLACDRNAAGVTADPDGLYLNYIEYPEAYKILQPKPICYTIFD
jgi:tRNA pseudouridine38-40 synthase